MHRTTSTTFFVASLIALLLGTACTSTVPGAAAPAAGTTAAAPTTTAAADPVEWMDDVCGALVPFLEAATDQPQLDTSDPVGTVEGISTYLGKVAASLDKALAQLKAAGPSPVVGGDKLVSRVAGALTTFKTTVTDAKTKIDAIDASDPQQLANDLPEAVAGLQELANFPDPTADLKANPELDRAAAKAPNCKKLSPP